MEPSKYFVWGCEGKDSLAVNGVYIITRHRENGRPLYVKLGKEKLWLVFKQQDEAATGEWCICSSITNSEELQNTQKCCSKTEDIFGPWSNPGINVKGLNSDKDLVCKLH